MPAQKPTNWVIGIVLPEKTNGKLRVCVDPRCLNKTIKPEHLHLPTTEGIFSQMSGETYFSKLASSSGYWQIKVISIISVISSSYRFKPLPCGI